MIDWRLTRSEQAILERLESRAGQTVPYELLTPCTSSRSLPALRVHISRLRAKGGVSIRTIRGLGYRLVA